MTQTLHTKLSEWRDAERKACAAERSLTHLLFERLDEPPPTDRLAAEARLLRQQANEKLRAAIAALRPKR